MDEKLNYRTYDRLLDDAFAEASDPKKTLPTRIEFMPKLMGRVIEKIREYNLNTDVVRYALPQNIPWYLIAKTICLYNRFVFGKKVDIHSFEYDTDDTVEFERAIEYIHDTARELDPALSAKDMDSIVCYIHDVSERRD